MKPTICPLCGANCGELKSAPEDYLHREPDAYYCLRCRGVVVIRPLPSETFALIIDCIAQLPREVRDV